MGRKYVHDVTSPRNKALLCILQCMRGRICLCRNLLHRGKEAGNMPAALLPQLNGIFHLPQVQLKIIKMYKNTSDTRIKALLLQHNSLVVNNNLREFMMFWWSCDHFMVVCVCYQANRKLWVYGCDGWDHRLTLLSLFLIFVTFWCFTFNVQS